MTGWHGSLNQPVTSPAGNAPTIGGERRATDALPHRSGTRTDTPIVARVVPVRTPPLRTLAFPAPPVADPGGESEPGGTTEAHAAGAPDAAVQRGFGPLAMPPPSMTFEGMAGSGPIPPDVEGDIGPRDYVQWVNVSYAVYDRSGGLLLGPAAGNSLFSALPSGLCKTTNRGDPIVLYDQLADRWVLSQFAYVLPRAGPYFQCIAVSTSGDPTGAYCLYPFQVSPNIWNDYGKIGLWPDAYYFSFGGVPDSGAPQFTPVAWAVDRRSMLACDPAASVYFDTSNAPDLTGAADPLLPADLDGQAQPPPGRPNPYVMSVDGSPDRLSLFELHVDWTNPAASTFTKKADLVVPSFDSSFTCNTPTDTRQCIPQPDTSTRLDVLAKQLMKRLTFRMFGDHESLVVNQSVDADTDHAGVRWYELRDPHGTPAVYQASTYAPDVDHRWLGSAAMDGRGDLAIGYSVSGEQTYPSLRYAGRPAGAPLGQLTLDEATLFSGSGSQAGPARWGDYSSLSVDPVDDCTFWYAGEYYPATASISWHTRIGTFKFPQCGPPTAVAVNSFDARWRSGRVVVSWRSAHETNILGFDVYRSAGGGPFTRLNRLLIAAKRPGTARGTTYRLADSAVNRAKTYTYRLQVVSTTGVRTWYGIGVAAVG